MTTPTETISQDQAPLLSDQDPDTQAEPNTSDTFPGMPEAEKLVPVSEAIRYRKRAQAAEQQLDEARGQLDQIQTQLHASQDTITSLERRQKIDALLSEADAIDLEAARLLTEISVSQMDEPDVSEAVRDLRRQKPYLFRHRAASTDAAMAPRLDAIDAQAEAAERAAATGDRRDLLDYLRIRRK